MSGWFDIDAITDKIKNSVDEASKLVADMNLDNMQELQEREENDPEFAAHNAAVRRHQKLMAELREKERKEREPQEFFTAGGLWDEPVMRVEEEETEEEETEEEESLYEDGPEPDDMLGLGLGLGDDELDTSDPGLEATQPSAPFSLSADVSNEPTELPAMPKISFSMKPAPVVAVDDAVVPETAKSEARIHSEGRLDRAAVDNESDKKTDDSAVLSSRLAVSRESSRLWATLRGGQSAAQSAPVALNGTRAKPEPRPLFFDRVDEEVDLEADPILKQVALNRTDPGAAQRDRATMKDVMARIMKPFESMRASRATQGASAPAPTSSRPLPQHYGDLPQHRVHQEADVTSVAWSLLSNCVVLVKLLMGLLLSALAFVFPFLRSAGAHLVSVWGRLIAAGSAQRNGERVPLRDRVNNVGWCMWTHVSSRTGLGTLTGLLIIYSYWKLEHEFWG